MELEVLIIGGGIIGLSIARELFTQGVKQLTIVDRGPLGAEASWAAAGMLAPNIESDTNSDFHRFGTESLRLYPDLADSLRDETGIDIELDRSGTFRVAFDEKEAADLLKTYEQQRKLGVTVERLKGDEVRDREPSVATGVCSALFYPNDWQVENRKLVSSLRLFAEINGIRIIEDTGVSELIVDGRRVTGARTPDAVIDADVIVLATGAWTSLIQIAGVAMPLEVKPVRGQMVSFTPGGRLARHVIYSERGYIVPKADGRVLAGATVEDVGFERGTTAGGIDSLRTAAAEIAPALGKLSIADQWSGFRPHVPDGLPVIGVVPGYENVWVATGHYRNGILLAPITAKIVAEKIVNGQESNYLRMFGPGRFSAAAANTLGETKFGLSNHRGVWATDPVTNIF